MCAAQGADYGLCAEGEVSVDMHDAAVECEPDAAALLPPASLVAEPGALAMLSLVSLAPALP